MQAASPVCTELETIVLDWLGKYIIPNLYHFNHLSQIKKCPSSGKAIGLPDDFLALKKGSKGGGVIQVCHPLFRWLIGIIANSSSANIIKTSASECVLVTMLAARAQAIKHLKQQHPFVEEGHLLSKLMGYCSKEAHSCVEKAAMISFVKLRILEPDEKGSLRANTLIKVRGHSNLLIVEFYNENDSLS